MKEKILTTISNILNIKKELLEDVSEVIPYIGRVYGVYKARRLEQRLMKLEVKLSEWNIRLQLLEENDLDIIRYRIFPVFLEVLMDETEEEKIDLFVNGFNNTINKTNPLQYEKESCISFFEILQKLRFHEIEYFLIKYIQNNNDKANQIIADEGFREFIENKLIQLGLIKSISRQGIVIGSIVQNNPPRRSLTLFGENLYNFFRIN